MVASNVETGHTAAITLKTAAFLPLIGTLLLTVLSAIYFVDSALALAHGLIPAMAVLRLLVCLLASATVTLFLYVFNRAQSRWTEGRRALGLASVLLVDVIPINYRGFRSGGDAQL